MHRGRESLECRLYESIRGCLYTGASYNPMLVENFIMTTIIIATGNSLVVQCLGLGAFTAKGPSWGTKIP